MTAVRVHLPQPDSSYEKRPAIPPRVYAGADAWTLLDSGALIVTAQTDGTTARSLALYGPRQWDAVEFVEEHPGQPYTDPAFVKVCERLAEDLVFMDAEEATRLNTWPAAKTFVDEVRAVRG